MNEYRKKNGHTVWHWMRDCSYDPKSAYDSAAAEPPLEELCSECRRRQREAQAPPRLFSTPFQSS